jgi:hypothetical protein
MNLRFRRMPLFMLVALTAIACNSDENVTPQPKAIRPSLDIAPLSANMSETPIFPEFSVRG